MQLQLAIFLLLLSVAVVLSVVKKKLTVPAAVTGGLVACFIFLGAGFTGVAMLGCFFLLGTLATSWKIEIKEKLAAAERDRGRRTTRQVLANGGVAGIAGLLAFVLPQQQPLFCTMMAASLAAAAADTLSSELGTVYGKRFYNTLTLKKDRRGENGVVSAEGFLFGLGGSMLIAGIYVLTFGWSRNFYWIIIAGTAGNIVDSILGATLERSRLMGNDVVNFLNTLSGALVAWLLMRLF